MQWDASPSSARPRILPGTQLNGIYEIETLIASGGMGDVFKGHAIETKAAVAIKIMRPELAENDAALALFRKEALALGDLHHEAIVRYYVFAVEPTLRYPYLAMEFVDGQSLSRLLQHGPLTFEAVRALTRRIAAGLQAAHEHGIVHRDVSPDNIIIPHGEVARAKIIDFGIARSTRPGDGTVIGSGFAGKYNYVSPEQLGLFGGDVTAKSDIYSLGLVLAEALSSRPIDMGGSQAEVVEKRRKLPDLGAYDLPFRPLLECMLQPDPAKRPDSMATVAAWPLGEVKTGGAAATQRHDGTSGPGRRGWRHALAAAAALALAAGALVYFLPELLEAYAAARITGYINQYDGGDCFFIKPGSVGRTVARIEGYGASIAPFTALNQAFRSANGFEADIDGRLVTAAQCPAITVLGRLRGERTSAPRLATSAYNLRSGQSVTGTVDHYGKRQIELLLVSEDGAVRIVTDRLTPVSDGGSFDIPLQRTGSGTGAETQLLMAIASSQPLTSLKIASAPDAGQLFSRMLAEIEQSGLRASATVEYLKVAP